MYVITAESDDTIAIRNRDAMTRKMVLSPNATKLYIWCASQIKKTDEDVISFAISDSDFAKSFNSKNPNRDLDRRVKLHKGTKSDIGFCWI